MNIFFLLFKNNIIQSSSDDLDDKKCNMITQKNLITHKKVLKIYAFFASRTVINITNSIVKKKKLEMSRQLETLQDFFYYQMY